MHLKTTAWCMFAQFATFFSFNVLKAEVIISEISTRAWFSEPNKKHWKRGLKTWEMFPRHRGILHGLDHNKPFLSHDSSTPFCHLMKY